MSSVSQDPNTQKMYEMIMKYFDLNDLRELYFSLGIDWDGVPQPANKQHYVWHLLRFIGSNQDQDLLLSKLIRLRPRLFWPKTFSIPVAMQSTANPGNISIGTFIGRQNVNINLAKTSAPRKTSGPRTSKKRRPSSSQPSKTSQAELELFNNVFALTKLYVFVAVIIFVVLPVIAGVWIYLNEQIWQGDGLLLFIFIGLFIVMLVIAFKLIFKLIYSKVSRFTNFYQLNVSTRQRVKGKLQNRNWGNGFWNFICRMFIGVFLQPDKSNTL